MEKNPSTLMEVLEPSKKYQSSNGEEFTYQGVIDTWPGLLDFEAFIAGEFIMMKGFAVETFLPTFSIL